MFFDEYKSELKKVIDEISNDSIENYAKMIIECEKNGGTVYVIGNGGSASTASHFQCDLGKGAQNEGKRRIRVISLTDNVALMSAISNDISYDDVFLYQLENVLSSKDLLIGISASGNSTNVVKCFEYAKGIGVKTFALVGFTGGKMLELADKSIYVRSSNYGIVEDAHLMLGHLVAQYIKKIR